MIRKVMLIGAILALVLLASLFITLRAGVFGAAPFWARIAPTDLPPAVLTQVFAGNQTQQALDIAATYSALPTTYTPDIHATATSWLPNPTYFPPVKATQLSSMIQTQQAAALLPTPDGQSTYPWFPQTSADDILCCIRTGRLAGYGILTDLEAPGFYDVPDQGNYKLNNGAWEEDTYGSVITIWSGHLADTPSQGIVYISIMPRYDPLQKQFFIESPSAVGDLRITDAVGERLILQSSQGSTLYFDVPALSFVPSLDELVPTATSVPTSKPYIPSFLQPMDDAPDLPYYADLAQPENNTDLDYVINSPTDYDWFYFEAVKPGTIKVSINRLAGSYGLGVVRLISAIEGGEIVGEDLTPGQGKKEVLLPDALAGDYLVRVWSLDGTFDLDKPYKLRFDAPVPEKVTPMLECVSDNGDGTYTAHFGYDNPNAFITFVGAGHDNAFHPGPVFRTEQPEDFLPGRVVDWFQVLFDGNGLTWVLDGHAVTANRNSPACP